MDILFFVFIVLTDWTFSICQAQSQVDFVVVQNHDFDNLIAPSGYIELAESGSTSRIQCAARCCRTTDCVSFFYINDTSVCQFHSTYLQVTAGMTSLLSSSYYRIEGFTGCPSGWQQFRSSCYLCETTAVRNYDDAKVFCENNGGRVLRIDDAEEATFITDLLPTLSPAASSYAFWLGLTDLAAHGTFIWEDTGATPTFTDWGATQPQFNTERCAVLYIPDSYKWHDVGCSTPFHTICKKS